MVYFSVCCLCQQLSCDDSAVVSVLYSWCMYHVQGMPASIPVDCTLKHKAPASAQCVDKHALHVHVV